METTKVGVIGAGSWGTALAVLVAGQGSSVALWGHDSQRIWEMKSTGENAAYLPGVPLPQSVVPTNSLEDAVDASVILFVTPSKAARSVAHDLASLQPPEKTIFISCTKGIEHGTGMRMTEVLSEFFPATELPRSQVPITPRRWPGRCPLPPCWDPGQRGGEAPAAPLFQ